MPTMTACTLKTTPQACFNNLDMTFAKPTLSAPFSLQQQHAEFWAAVHRDSTVENWLLSTLQESLLGSLQTLDLNTPTPNIDRSIGLKTSMLCQSPGCEMFSQVFHDYSELFVPVTESDGNTLGITLHEAGTGTSMRRMGRFVHFKYPAGREELVVITQLKAVDEEGLDFLHMERYVDQGSAESPVWVKDTAVVRASSEGLPNQLVDVVYWSISVQSPSQSIANFLRSHPGVSQRGTFDMIKYRTGEYDIVQSRLDETDHGISGIVKRATNMITSSWTYSMHSLFCRNFKLCVDEALADELVTLRTAFARLYDPAVYSPRSGIKMSSSQPFEVFMPNSSGALSSAFSFSKTADNIFPPAVSTSLNTQTSAQPSAPPTATPKGETKQIALQPIRRTRRSFKNSTEPLTPTQIRNRLAAKRSNEKKRRYIQSVKAELAELHSHTVPDLKNRLSSLEAENLELKRKAVEAFGKSAIEQPTPS